MIIPTFQELYASIRTDIKNRLSIISSATKKVYFAFSAVQAGKLKIFYLALAQVYKNIFVDQADYDTIVRMGQVKLGRLPYPAVAGEYTLNVSGTIGASIAAGTTFKSLDTSTSPDSIFTLDTVFTFIGTTCTISVRSLEPGADSRLEVADELQVTAPIANVDSFSDVASVDVAPVAEEDIEEYRLNVIQAFRVEPQGGAKTDYMLWSQDAAGVRRSYPYAISGELGNINLYIEAFVSDSSDGKGTPTGAIKTDVEAVVEYDPDTTKPNYERGRRPMGTFIINFLDITPLDVDVEIKDLTVGVDISAISTAIETFIYQIRPYINGGDPPADQNDRLYEADIYRIVRDVLLAGETFTSIELIVDSVSVDLYTFENGDIPYLNSVTVV